MYKYFDNKLKKDSVNLAPGEFFVSGDDIVINTVLGSCVSVALYDSERKIAGLNHFMLAEAKLRTESENIFNVERYGLNAMESLMTGLIKLGSSGKCLQAKIFGGSAVLETRGGGQMEIGADNISFAEKFLKAENIPVINRDTGGVRARRIYLYPQSFRILLRRVKPNVELRDLMDVYKHKLDETKNNDGTTVLF
ncbi:MAG TPA: chemoreceptor glutamine deamidase CheD [Spirochaeta sp.]|nr:chemoreceptor glutamine deamidase CheD [Spirochaeta sp.]